MRTLPFPGHKSQCRAKYPHTPRGGISTGTSWHGFSTSSPALDMVSGNITRCIPRDICDTLIFDLNSVFFLVANFLWLLKGLLASLSSQAWARKSHMSPSRPPKPSSTQQTSTYLHSLLGSDPDSLHPSEPAQAVLLKAFSHLY